MREENGIWVYTRRRGFHVRVGRSLLPCSFFFIVFPSLVLLSFLLGGWRVRRWRAEDEVLVFVLYPPAHHDERQFLVLHPEVKRLIVMFLINRSGRRPSCRRHMWACRPCVAGQIERHLISCVVLRLIFRHPDGKGIHRRLLGGAMSAGRKQHFARAGVFLTHLAGDGPHMGQRRYSRVVTVPRMRGVHSTTHRGERVQPPPRDDALQHNKLSSFVTNSHSNV